MIKKYFALLLSLMIATLSFALTPSAKAQSALDSEKTRTKVQTLSLNRDKKIEVKLRDKTNIKGYITAVDPDSFTVSDPKTGSSETIAYSEVESVGKSGGGLSTKTWLIIGGVAAGAVTGWLIAKPALCDGGAQTRGIC